MDEKIQDISRHLRGWGKEYFAIGRNPEDLQNVIGYIKCQKEHHKRLSFEG